MIQNNKTGIHNNQDRPELQHNRNDEDVGVKVEKERRQAQQKRNSWCMGHKKFFCRLLPARTEKLCLHHVTIELLLQQTFQLSGENNANNIRLKYYLPVEV